VRRFAMLEMEELSESGSWSYFERLDHSTGPTQAVAEWGSCHFRLCTWPLQRILEMMSHSGSLHIRVLLVPDRI
jgi:hypothetical protein